MDFKEGLDAALKFPAPSNGVFHKANLIWNTSIDNKLDIIKYAVVDLNEDL